ncbi:MAG: PASTA domain-containing protein [Nitrospinota bacterium]
MLRRLLRVLLLGVALVAVAVASGVLTLYLVTGGGEVVVPDLRGRDVVSALEALGQRELNVQIGEQRYSADVPKNHVIAQSPEPGRAVRRGRHVSLVLSRGTREVSVPDLQGENLARAESLVLANGLRVGAVSWTHSERRPRDSVLAQSPSPATLALRGGRVDLLVSSGRRKPRYAMPDFVGRDLARAMALIREMRLRVGQVRYEPYAGVREGAVISQTPRAGHRVSALETVNLTVAQDPAGRRATGTFALLRYRVPPGDRPRRVRVVVEEGGLLRELYNRLEQPGAEVSMMVRSEGKTKARIYLDGQLAEEREY